MFFFWLFVYLLINLIACSFSCKIYRCLSSLDELISGVCFYPTWLEKVYERTLFNPFYLFLFLFVLVTNISTYIYSILNIYIFLYWIYNSNFGCDSLWTFEFVFHIRWTYFRCMVSYYYPIIFCCVEYLTRILVVIRCGHLSSYLMNILQVYAFIRLSYASGLGQMW